MSDRYVVRARVDTGIVILKTPTSMTERMALDLHQRLVELTLPSRGVAHEVVQLGQPSWQSVLHATPITVHWWDVRAANHAGVQNRPEVDLRVLKRGRTRDLGRAIRRWAEAHGFHGHEGGWIHRTARPDHIGCPRTSMQGWSKLMQRGHVPKGAIVELDAGRGTYALTEEV